MANTYSSWEYSQGPTLYIDKSGFKTIDDNKNFTYYYIVEYSPVEYKRKVTDEKGMSYYEYKYSFGKELSNKKQLGEYTFTGKKQITKTVTHTVTEDGHTDTITKTFYIDTNMQSNIETNSQLVIDPKLTVDVHGYGFDSGAGISDNKFGWITKTETGYRSVTDYYVTYERVYGIVDWEWYYWLTSAGEDYTKYPIYNWYETPVYHYYTYKEPYSYSKLYNSYCKLDIKKIRDKMGEFEALSSISILMTTESSINKPPELSIDTSTSSTSLRTVLSPKNEGAHSAGSCVEYILPTSVLNKFKSYNEVTLILKKGSCSNSTAYFTNARAYLEIESDKMPYINLLVQAYNKNSDLWTTCCTIPYLNYKEIDALRSNKEQVSKNLFLPSNLPSTDAGYRIKLDTNMVAKETEMFTNFRFDVLVKQLLAPGSVNDKMLYICNDSEEYETEVAIEEVDDLELNALGSIKYEKIPHAGFLRKGANDIHAYLKNYVAPYDKSITNIVNNKWYGYIDKINGNWISDNIFIANTESFPYISILQGDDANLDRDIITFKIPYSTLRPNSTYTLLFEAHVQKAFTIVNVNTVNNSDVHKITKSKLFTTTSYDSNKITVTELNKDFYIPQYKEQRGSSSYFSSEYDICNKYEKIEYSFKTKNISNSDSGYLILKIRGKAIGNIMIKNMQCVCTTKEGVRHLDIFQPYNNNSFEGRQCETSMTVFYDGFYVEEINPLLYDDMNYLKQSLDKIRKDYTLKPYPWGIWNNKKLDNAGHVMGVAENAPIRADHFNEVKQCCVQTYEDLLALRPPVTLNTTPSIFRNNTGLIPLQDEDESKGYVLQHVFDKEHNPIEIDKYFPEWKKIIELINRN